MFDDFLPILDAESLPFYPLVLKLVVCTSEYYGQTCKNAQREVVRSRRAPVVLRKITVRRSASEAHLTRKIRCRIGKHSLKCVEFDMEGQNLNICEQYYELILFPTKIHFSPQLIFLPTFSQ